MRELERETERERDTERERTIEEGKERRERERDGSEWVRGENA